MKSSGRVGFALGLALAVGAALAGEDPTIGFWSFSGTPGGAVTAATNELDAADVLTGFAFGSGGTPPAYSDDVPGRYVTSALADGRQLAADARSVAFFGGSAPGVGGALKSADLRTRLSRLDAFTVEFFFKLDGAYTWRNWFATKFGDSLQVKIADRTLTQVCTQVGGGGGSEHYAEAPYALLGAWHHLALVWSRETSCLKTYVDYRVHTSVDSVGFPALASAQPAYFGCGAAGSGEAMNGKIFALRVSSAALAPEEMLSVCNEPTGRKPDAHEVFRWRFEDAPADGAAIVSTDAGADNAQVLRAHGLQQNSELPAYSSAAIDRRHAWVSGGGNAANRFAARFFGYSDDHPNTWAGSQVQQNAQIPEVPTLPPSFTFEFFLKRDLSPSARTGGSNGQLIAAHGKGPIDTPSQFSDWRLVWRAHGLEFVCTTETGEERSVGLGTTIDDGEWHHFAFSFDEVTDEVVLYLDYSPVETLALAAPLQRTQEYVHILGRGLNSSGFNGWIDEVRLSDTVLGPQDFLRLGRVPGLLLAIRGPKAPPPAEEKDSEPPPSPSPFVTDETVSGAAFGVRQRVVSASNTATPAEPLADYPSYGVGRKSVEPGLSSASATTRTPTDINAITVCGAGRPLARITFWGSAGSGNFGYPFADLAGDPATLTFDAATGVTRYVKPYAVDGVRREFSYVMSPTEDGRVRVDWDTGSTYGVQPWIVFENDGYRDAALSFGSVRYENFGTDELRAADTAGKTRNFNPGGLVSCDPGSTDTGFEIAFDGSCRGTTTESVSYTTYQSNLVYHLIYRLGSLAGGGTNGSFTVDLGEAMKVAEGGEEPEGQVRFWESDALEVPRRPTRNLLANPGFEQGFRHWRDGQGGAVYKEVPPEQERYRIVATNTPCGADGHALMVRSTQGNAMYIRTFPLSLEKGRAYTLSVFAKAPRNDVDAGIGLMSASPHGGFNWTTGKTGWRLTDQWARYTHTFVADGGGIMVEVGGYADGILFDGFQLEKGEVATEWTCDPIEGVLETARDDDQLTKSDPLDMTYAMRGPAGVAALVELRLQNAFREGLWTTVARVRFDGSGRAAVPVRLDPDVVQEGIFVLRAGYRMHGVPQWCDHHRFTRMDPADPNIATRDVFGNLYPDTRLVRADELVRRMNDWGFHSTTWGNTPELTEGSVKLGFIRKYDISNWGRTMINETSAFADYKSWTAVPDELAERIELVSYDTVRTNDARFAVWAFGNEEEYSTAAEKHPDEYAKAQVACLRGVKRANPDAWVLPTHGTSGYNPSRGHLQMDRYLEAALKLGVRYDAIGIHQYGNVDGGTLGSYEIVDQVRHLAERLRAYGYPDSTPILTTECFDITETYLPEWGTTSYDSYKAGNAGYAFSNREFVQAASVARIYLSVLHDWPRHRMANIWVSTPIVDHDQMPLLLCKVPHTLGRHFDDVAWIGDVRRDADGVRAFVFRRGDGTGVAALWVVDNEIEFGYRRGPTVSLSLPSDTTAYDLMGCRRRLVRKDGVSEIRLTPAPLILRAADPEALLSALDASNF